MSKECPNCGSDMEINGASGTQRSRGRSIDVAVSWSECPECDTVITPDGREITNAN